MTWEYATLGWYIDVRQRASVFFWRTAGREMEPLAPDAYLPRLAQAGLDGWELVSTTAMPDQGETLYLKRALSQGRSSD